MKKLNTVVLMGGRSAEHDVSVITGLQVIEHVDLEQFEPHAIVLTQDNTFLYYSGLKKRGDFKRIKPTRVIFASDEKGPYIRSESAFAKKLYLDVAYLAFHGGNGESGQIQGFCETINLPYTSPSMEASVLSMNKVVTKEVLEKYGVNLVPWMRLFSIDIKKDVSECTKVVEKHLGLPVIIKPAHLGSSIGINVAKTKVELKKYLNEASFVDSEILIEKYIKNFKEYNCSVRRINDQLEASEIEEPMAHDEILSFADKYQRGGNKKGGGMASLVRKLPAPISEKQREQIQQQAKKVFELVRAKGMVRIDFMYFNNKLHVTEINPIPGSMAFFLWEASGISFQDQITDMLLQAQKDHQLMQSKKIVYTSDIVDKFVSNQ